MDVYPPSKRSEVMRRVRSRDTQPELSVRRIVHRLGFRFRLNVVELPGSPDLVLPRLRKVIFVHGCFWHRHTCPAANLPVTRAEYWRSKLERNARRDRRDVRELRRAGWRVLVIWECQIKNQERLSKRLVKFLRDETDA